MLAGCLVALLLLGLLLYGVLGVRRSGGFQADTPLAYKELTYNGRQVASGELVQAGDRGPRGFRLGMSLEDAASALPLASGEWVDGTEAYTLLYGHVFDAQGWPLAPCAVLMVQGGRLELRILTEPSQEGLYGLVVCQVTPETGALAAIRWRSLEDPAGWRDL